MAPENGPFRERFEEYILERTANHPSLVPMIMHGQGKARFRLACKETLEPRPSRGPRKAVLRQMHDVKSKITAFL